MNDVVAAILFFLPAGVANAAPVVANKIPLLNKWETPVDFGKSWRGKRLLGPNKRWRGLATGTVLAGLTALLIAVITREPVTLAVFLLGAVMGFGALVGDAVESFFKRQHGVAAGKSWFPFDQTDYIIGGLVFVYPFTLLPITSMLLIFVLFFGLHLVFAYIGYMLGLKDKPI